MRWEWLPVIDRFPQVGVFSVEGILTRLRGCLRSKCSTCNDSLISIHLSSYLHLVLVENKLSGLEFFKTSRYLRDGVGWEVDMIISSKLPFPGPFLLKLDWKNEKYLFINTWEINKVELLQAKQGHWEAGQLVVVQVDLPEGKKSIFNKDSADKSWFSQQRFGHSSWPASRWPCFNPSRPIENLVSVLGSRWI